MSTLTPAMSRSPRPSLSGTDLVIVRLGAALVAWGMRRAAQRTRHAGAMLLSDESRRDLTATHRQGLLPR